MYKYDNNRFANWPHFLNFVIRPVQAAGGWPKMGEFLVMEEVWDDVFLPIAIFLSESVIARRG
jgi:hypothetical protein